MSFKRLIQILTSRVVVTGVLILIQLGWFLVFLTTLAQHAVWISALFALLSMAIVLSIVSKDVNPAYKIEWIILIEAVPLLGGLLYLLFGNKRPTRRMQGRFLRERRRFAPLLAQQPQQAAGLSGRARGTARYVQKNGPFPVWRDTSVTYYPLGEEMFADMMRAIEAAEHFIFLEYFIITENSYMWQTMLEALARKAAAGLDVRLIYDDLGSVALLPPGYAKKMEALGIRCLAFNPFVPVMSLVMNNRDHRKILVVDGHTAFNGGINLSDEYINRTHPHGHWKDTGLRLAGEGAWNLTAMFLQTWHAFRPGREDMAEFLPHRWHAAPFAGSGWVQPFGDSPLDDEPVSENVYIDLLSQAQSYAYIFTPYLALSNELQSALCLAARRGVDVRVVTPGIPDKPIVYRLTRSYYPALLKAGVRVFEYTPGFLHAKSMLVDGEVGVVGTINMDFRSLYLHFECGTLLYGCDALADLKRDCMATFGASREVGLQNCRLSVGGRLLSALLRVFAPLM